MSDRHAPQPVALDLPTGTETIILIEDDPSLRQLAGVILEGCGYTVRQAGEGERALAIAADHSGPIDLLLTDVVMPGGGGRQAAERFQARYPALKIIFMSGYPDDMVVRHGVVEAGVHFLQKPFTPLALALKVREVLDERAAYP